MTPLVIVRRPHTLTRYTSDETALPYRGWYAHAPRVYLTGTPVLDVLGRRNGLTHTWLAYACANVGCRYLLLVRAEHAHDLAHRDLTTTIRWDPNGIMRFGAGGGVSMVDAYTESARQFAADLDAAIQERVADLAAPATLSTVHGIMVDPSNELIPARRPTQETTS